MTFSNRLTALMLFGLMCGHISTSSAEAAAPAAKSQKRRSAPKSQFNGWPVAESRLRTTSVAKPSGKIEIYSLHDPKTVLSVSLYRPDGSYDPTALDALNHMWRCRRTETEKSIDPHIFEVLSHIYDRFKKPIALISGFRNQRRVTSYHYVGSAADVTIQGMADGVLKAFVESLDTGGMGIGIYPHAGFIHVDVRPEPSFRWVDSSPPGSSEMGQPKTQRPRAPNT